MELKIKSKHVKFYKYFYNTNFLPDYYLNYYFKLLIAIILLIPKLILSIPTYLQSKKVNRNVRQETTVIIWLCLFSIIHIIMFIYELVIYHSIISIFGYIGCFIILFILSLFIVFIISNLEDKFGEKIKNKFKIKWKDDL